MMGRQNLGLKCLCPQSALTGVPQTRCPGKRLLTPAGGLKVNSKRPICLACLSVSLGPRTHWQGPDSALTQEHIWCVFPQTFVADENGLMVVMVLMVSAQHMFVENKKNKTEPRRQVLYYIVGTLSFPRRYTFGKGKRHGCVFLFFWSL